MKNLDEDNITEAVLASMDAMPDNRLRTIVTSLVRHLHSFARETHLTEAEWMQGIEFLTATGHKSAGPRQEFILLSDVLGLSQLVVAQNHSRADVFTEQTVFGPFHVEGAPEAAQGADLARGAVGDPLYFKVQVHDGEGAPLPDARVDVWQADADGFYDVQDPGWSMECTRLRAVFRTDQQGHVSGRSVMPSSYPIPLDGPVGTLIQALHRHPMRPAHIHFMIQKPGYETLVTHVFVDGDEYLDSDVVFGVRSSCIGTYVRHDGGTAPDGTRLTTPFYTMEFDFRVTRD